MSCTTCFEATIPECVTPVTVKAGLEPNIAHQACITDHHGNKYFIDCTSASNGDIDIQDVVGGSSTTGGYLFRDMLRGFSSPYKLQFLIDNAPQTLTIGGHTYDCIIFTLYPASGDVPTAVIPAS
jgi:hypothetical protein